MNGLDLFSGIGGITLGLIEWVRPVAYCESDRYAQSVLLSRMADGKLPIAPIWDDIRTLKGNMLPRIDIVYGGFPCQDVSVCGSRKGMEGNRTSLFFELSRLVDEIRPRFIFLENVPGIVSLGLEPVVSRLTSMGYDSRWTIVPAAEVGAPHLRKRWFMLAHICKTMANANSTRFKKLWGGCATEKKYDPLKQGGPSCHGWWPEPSMGRVANGVRNRVDRIKCLGNAVVPIQAKEAFERLIGLK